MFKLKSEIREIDSVFRFKIDFPPFDGLKFVCVYLLKVDDSYVLIDAGLHFNDWKKLFLSGIKELNISINDIEYCIITHEHIDHIGLINTLKKKNPQIKILMHDITHKLIEWGTNSNHEEEIRDASKELADTMIKYGMSIEQGNRIIQFFTNWHKLLQYHKPDKILNDNDEIFCNKNKLRIIWTPGHSVGHICVFDVKKQYLFSGDHILSGITPHIGSFILNPLLKQNYDFTNILDYYLKSLDRIEDLNPKIIFPAHQEVIYNPHERIIEIKKHHANRLREIAEIIKDKPLTPLRISQIHFGEELSEINIFLAISEVVSHLIYLEYQHKVNRIEKDGKILFSS